MYTYQDFVDRANRSSISDAVQAAISYHMGDAAVMTAKDADAYDHQKNKTILSYVKWLYGTTKKTIDTTSSNNKLCSNFFHRLNTQRNTYSLGNGIYFDDVKTKEQLGDTFDTELKKAGYAALIHGISFMFWNVDHVHVYKYTEFMPLWDEETGALRAGIRYWQIDAKKPVFAVLYEEDGFTKMSKSSKTGGKFVAVEEKRAYRTTYRQAFADTEPEVVGEENYTALPIIPMYGSRLHQSTLVGMREKIDAYDLVRSGFANDLQDCAEIYWLINGAGGMNERDLARFRDRLRINHIANAGNADDVKITPYTQDIPHEARKTFLDDLRSQIYEDFGALDVHTVAAGATNDHIDAAYQPLDEEADDYEYEIIQAVQNLLRLISGKEETPYFMRNRISNKKEQTDMVLSCAEYLDDETILRKMPFLTPDEVEAVIEKREAEEYDRFNAYAKPNPGEYEGDSEEDEEDINTGANGNRERN